MKKLTNGMCCLGIVAASISVANANDGLYEAVKAGDVSLNLRLRYENVDQGRPSNRTADALTLRTRLNYKTNSFRGFTGFLEVDDVSAADGNAYNSTSNGQVNKAVIVDPQGTEVNQAWLGFQYTDTNVKYGRQRILLDNQRFVGGVGFRQNEQTFDAFSVSNSSLPDTQIFLAHVNNVNRIFGEDSPAGDHYNKTELLNVKYSGLSAGDVIVYAYLLDDQDFNRFSTDSYGVRFQGAVEQWSYAFEYATQENAGNNALDYSAEYRLVELGYKHELCKVKLGYELLGSDNGNASFMTPLATMHKFQGWTDQFIVTPAQGINDVYVSVGTLIQNVKLLFVYHEFWSDVDNAIGEDDLGSEVGFLASKVFKHAKLEFKAASYSAGDNSFGKSDTDIFWLTASTQF